jgi:hypothetical protein
MHHWNFEDSLELFIPKGGDADSALHYPEAGTKRRK